MRDDPENLKNTTFINCVEWVDVYIYTQGRALRRVSIPRSLIAFAAWVFDPRMAFEDAIFDRHICDIADEKRIGYAESFVELLHFCMEGESLWKGYNATIKDEEAWTPVHRGFVEEQARRRTDWREAHDDWRDPLPPALD